MSSYIEGMMMELRQRAMKEAALDAASAYAMAAPAFSDWVYARAPLDRGTKPVPTTFCGIPVGIDPALPDGVVELRGKNTIRIDLNAPPDQS